MSKRVKKLLEEMVGLHQPKVSPLPEGTGILILLNYDASTAGGAPPSTEEVEALKSEILPSHTEKYTLNCHVVSIETHDGIIESLSWLEDYCTTSSGK